MRYENMKKIYKLECIRGFAATYVFLHHLFGHTNVLFRFGQEAVISFFLLSGFVINYSSLSNRPKTNIYLFNRFIRIYPMLIISIFLSLIISVYINKDSESINFYTLLGNLCMLQDCQSLKPGVLFNTFGGNSPLWSLSYEWWFYCLYGIILHYDYDKRKATYLVIVVSLISCIFYTLWASQLIRFMMYFSIWWAGVLISQYFYEGEMGARVSMLSYIAPIYISILLTTIILGVSVLYSTIPFMFGVHPFLECRHFASAFFMISVLMLWHRMSFVGFNKLFYVFRFIAPFSYGLYIFHYPIINSQLLSGFSLSIKFVLSVFIAFGFSYLIELYVQPVVSFFLRRRFYLATSPIYGSIQNID
jgi:peptidoglycan/LPS O-acetylase OafA/YrhL